MAWCPICKKEYDEQITTCESCNVSLLEGYEEDFSELLSDKDERLILTTYTELLDRGFDTALYYIDNDDIYHLIVGNEQFDDAYELVSGDISDQLHSAGSDTSSSASANVLRSSSSAFIW